MNRKLVAYFTLAYALSWSVFVPLALAKQNVIAPIPAWLHILGAFGPFVSAFVVTVATTGRSGVRELLGRITRWRIGWIWWAVALLSPVVLFFLGALVAGIVAGDWSVMGQFGAMAELPQFGGVGGWLVWVLTWLYNSTGGSVLTAIVWHGTYNAAAASGNGVVSAVVTAGVIGAAIFIANHFGLESFSHRERQMLSGCHGRKLHSPRQ